MWNHRESKILISNTDGYSIIPASSHFLGTLTLEQISDKMSNFTKFNVALVKNAIEYPAKYAPSFSVESSTAKVALLHNQQGQGNYGLCWAASVATVANYVYGTSHTAMNVADAMGKGYNDGGTTSEMQTALNYYAITYSYIVNSQLSYSVIQTNIQNQRPPIVYALSNAGTDDEAAHAVTLYGYGGGYIYLWNSGMNSGAGGSQLILYNSTATTFPYGNATFTWTKTVSAAS